MAFWGHRAGLFSCKEFLEYTVPVTNFFLFQVIRPALLTSLFSLLSNNFRSKVRRFLFIWDTFCLVYLYQVISVSGLKSWVSQALAGLPVPWWETERGTSLELTNCTRVPAHPQRGCRHHGSVNGPWPPFQPCLLLPDHLVQGRLVWTVVLQGSRYPGRAWQEGHPRVTGLSPELSECIQHSCGLQACKTSSLTWCWLNDQNSGPWDTLGGL